MSHQNHERRRRYVYTTRNTEYHTFDKICVGVRDRNTGAWLGDHAAVARRIEGGVRIFSNGAVLPSLSTPEIGDALYFILEDAPEDRQLVTSRLQEITRPRPEDLTHYPVAS